MRIMSVLGSPRAEGNTAKILDWIEEHLRTRGHDVHRVSVTEHSMGGCVECYACKSGKIPLCVLKDEGNTLYEELIAADLVLLAAPLFCWNFPAQMKPFIDRMFCLASATDKAGRYSTKVEGKPFAMLMTAAGAVEGNADILVRTYENLVAYLKARDTGQLVVPHCSVPADIGEDVRQRAMSFAERLASRAG